MDINTWTGLNARDSSQDTSQENKSYIQQENTTNTNTNNKRNLKNDNTTTTAKKSKRGRKENVPVKINPSATTSSDNNKLSPLATTNNNGEHKAANAHVPNFLQEDEDDVLLAYTTAAPRSRQKKPFITYGRNPNKGRTNFLDRSQQDDFMKCGKCGKSVSEDSFKTHTDSCLLI